MKNDVRVRMAPSPTGFFHVGSARTALYNWLFARHNKGKFILRVEDTDVERSSEKMIEIILDGMRWLGMDWDEGPLYQSSRIPVYQKYVQTLLEKGHAYYCYCDPGDLEKERQAAYKRKEDWQYDRRCLNLSQTERAEKERQKVPRVVRFLVPDAPVSFRDIIHHDITREAKDIEDLVIMRSSGMPTYNLACVVDDHEMGISHVIRAVDHITNTPKQILLFRALGLDIPEYAHLPLILGEDKSKLSKRHGAVSVTEYRDRGYLPGAMFNYLALLGWSPGDDREKMNKDEITESFDLGRINASNAVFDEQKLEWMNGQYIYALSDEDLFEQITPFIISSGLLAAGDVGARKDWLLKVCGLIKLRLKTLADVTDVAEYFFTDDFTYEQEGMAKHFNPEAVQLLSGIVPLLEALDDYTAASVEKTIRDHAEQVGTKVRQIIHPLRLSLTGKQGGPGLFEIMELVGKGGCLSRIRRYISAFKKKNQEENRP